SKIVDITFDKLYNDKQLQGKEVRIKGIIAINFEDIALYPSKSSNSKKALWIIFSSDVDNNFTELEKYKGHKVELTGNINLSHKGHESYYFATISNVTCIKQVD
ncbi:MAG: hypothetical protein ACXWV9_09625, partial [Flavisolibacter sp.]